MGQILQEERKRTNVSLSEPAKKICVSKGYLSRVESGKTKIAYETIKK
ncbi:MAG: helix-turn-helix transcriptional regulator [Deltaproteobacteria bacterium]|nr:helix-turn-helix transcriptional regulator [Deltaproteobacteria bacterium]